MRLKCSKEELLRKLESEVYPYPDYDTNFTTIPLSDLNSAVKQYARDAAKKAVMTAIQVLLREMYTTQEFESDIGLR